TRPRATTVFTPPRTGASKRRRIARPLVRAATTKRPRTSVSRIVVVVTTSGAHDASRVASRTRPRPNPATAIDRGVRDRARRYELTVPWTPGEDDPCPRRPESGLRREIDLPAGDGTVEEEHRRTRPHRRAVGTRDGRIALLHHHRQVERE